MEPATLTLPRQMGERFDERRILGRENRAQVQQHAALFYPGNDGRAERAQTPGEFIGTQGSGSNGKKPRWQLGGRRGATADDGLSINQIYVQVAAWKRRRNRSSSSSDFLFSHSHHLQRGDVVIAAFDVREQSGLERSIGHLVHPQRAEERIGT